MAEMVGSVLVQEGLSKALSFIMGKREEKASEGLCAERLEMAVSELEFALERTAKLPVTDASLLHRRKMIRRAYLEGTELFKKHKSQELQGQEEIDRGGKRKRWFARAKNRLSISSFSGLRMDDVRRFEWFADHAGKFVRDVEAGCSLRHHTFCNPHVRHLLEGKTLRYEVLQGSRLLRRLHMQPICLEGRGVETVLIYQYRDHKLPERSFNLVLILRLSESTDIVEIAIKCLKSMASQFKLVTEAAMGELTLLPDLQYISHSYDRSYAEIDLESYNDDSQYLRPDPICCKENGHGPCANGVFPEEVIHFFFRCSISSLGCNLPISSCDGAGRRRGAARDWRAPLNLTVGCMPHHVYNGQQLQENYALEIFGNDEERGDVSIHNGGVTLRMKAADFFLHQPELTEYRMLWISKHGVVGFFLENPSTKRACAQKTSDRLSSRMAAACHRCRSISFQQRSLEREGTEELEHGGQTCPFGPWAV